MTTRGVKYSFSVGEHVLCFEPDPTKARVLYQAKVLDLCPGKDKLGRRKPEYHIHFQGWNNSWDRIVGEDFILKNSEENKLLMRRLAETARKFATNYSRKNRTRKQKIDAILRGALVKKPKFDSGSESDSGSDSESDVTGDGDEISEESEVEEHVETKNGTDNDEQNNSVDMTETDSDDEISIKGKSVHVEIPIPKTLRDFLEEDYFNVNRERQLLKLPSELNVVGLIEGYVKHFVMNILFSTTEKLRPGLREFTRPEPEKSIPLCKEVMQGLRVCFDFTLPVSLLYKAEKEQFLQMKTVFKPTCQKNGPPLIKKEVQSPEIEEPQSPIASSSSRRRSSHRLHSGSGGEPSPKIPKLSKEDNEEIEEPPRRRLTRLSVTEVVQPETQTVRAARRQRKPINNVTSEPKLTRSTRRNSQASSAIANDERSCDAVESVIESHPNSHTADLSMGLSHRVTPPPPLLMPNALSSHASSPHLTPTIGNNQTCHSQTASDKEMVLNEILTWKLLPPELEKTPVPSLIYGPVHLLRLFVKLPELLSKMNMGEQKLKALLKHLELFLEYLSNHQSELFSDGLYGEPANCGL